MLTLVPRSIKNLVARGILLVNEHFFDWLHKTWWQIDQKQWSNGDVDLVLDSKTFFKNDNHPH